MEISPILLGVSEQSKVNGDPRTRGYKLVLNKFKWEIRFLTSEQWNSIEKALQSFSVSFTYRK